MVIAVVAVVAALALMGYLLRGSGKSSGFKTVQVKRGDLQATISATGTVEPEEISPLFLAALISRAGFPSGIG